MKKLLTWTNALSVGIEELDEQHKELVSIINKTHELTVNKKDGEKLKLLLEELVEFARIHFSTEDNYFKQWEYPYANEHDIEHEKLLLKALQFLDRFNETEGISLSSEFLELLKDWLENHLKKHDFKYRDYVKENNLS